MEEEGHDPATFRFDDGDQKSTPTKRTRQSESAVEPDTEETPAMEDMIVQDDAGDEEEADNQVDKQDEATELDNQTSSEEKMEVEEGEKTNRKREIHDEPEDTVAKKICLEKEDDQKVDINTDGEDSINLDIGDDELLNEEVCFYFFRVTVTLPAITSKISNGYMMDID